MKTILMSTVAFTLAVAASGAQPAFAKNDQLEQREALKAEAAAIRAANKSGESRSLFEVLFGSDEAEVAEQQAETKSTN